MAGPERATDRGVLASGSLVRVCSLGVVGGCGPAPEEIQGLLGFRAVLGGVGEHDEPVG
jgi:hypothetical protein